jgi:6-phosphogluconolactonase
VTQPHVVVLDGPHAVAARAAEEFEIHARAAIAARNCFAVALSGGKTPTRSFEMLVSPRFIDTIDWPRVHFFWGDERCVPPDDPASNYAQARKSLLDPIHAQEKSIHRMRGELEPRDGARDYAAFLDRFFGGAAVFDLVFLGLGRDGHTASLFPNARALEETAAACVSTHVPGNLVPWRLTLTYPVFNAARAAFFLVTGADKADVLARVLEGPRQPATLPAQGVAPTEGSLTWLVDRAAAARLKQHA